VIGNLAATGNPKELEMLLEENLGIVDSIKELLDENPEKYLSDCIYFFTNIEGEKK
jgi:hypothetical protein